MNSILKLHFHRFTFEVSTVHFSSFPNIFNKNTEMEVIPSKTHSDFDEEFD